MIFKGAIVPCLNIIQMKRNEKNGGGIQDAEVVAEEPREYANLTYDSGFKIVLGTEGKSEGLLMALLNRFLPDAGIVELWYLPPEHFGDSEDDGKSVFDVYCKDRNGTRYLIEMQMWTQHHFHKRAVYYAARSVMDQAREEKKYQKENLQRRWDYNFAPVYVICFLNFPCEIVGSTGVDAERHMAHYVFRSIESGRKLGDNVNLVFIDLYRFRKQYSECKDMKERWIYSLKNMHLLKEQPSGIEGTELEELYREAYMAKWTPEKIDKYRKLMTREDEILNSMREQREDAYRDGMEQGIERGREQGREQGRKQERIELAGRMIAAGMDIRQIADLTGLSVDAIQEVPEI